MSRFTSHARSSLPAFVALALYACSLQDFEYLQEGEAGASANGGKGGGKGGTAGATGGSSGSGGAGASGGNAGTPHSSGGAPSEAGQGGQAGTVGASGEGGAPTGGTAGGSTSAGGVPSAGQAGEGGVPTGAGGDPLGAGGTAGTPSEGGAGGQPPLVGNLLVNPGFDSGLTGWTIDPAVAVTNRYVYTQAPNPSNGTTSSLAAWHMTAEYEVFVYQTLTGLEPGTYTFKGEFSTTSIREAYMFARCGEEGAEEETTVPIPLQGFEWFPVIMQSFTVNAERCEVGIFLHGLAPEGGTPDWLNADLLSFEKDL